MSETAQPRYGFRGHVALWLAQALARTLANVNRIGVGFNINQTIANTTDCT